MTVGTHHKQGAEATKARVSAACCRALGAAPGIVLVKVLSAALSGGLVVLLVR